MHTVVWFQVFLSNTNNYMVSNNYDVESWVLKYICYTKHNLADAFAHFLKTMNDTGF